MAAHNGPVPEDDGSRQWAQTLAARLRATSRLVSIAGELGLLAQRQPGWPLALRYRLMAAAAFCIDGAPRVMLAAWSSQRSSATQQTDAAQQAGLVLPAILDTLNIFVQEVGGLLASPLS